VGIKDQGVQDSGHGSVTPKTNWPAVWVVFAGGLAAGAHIGKVPPAMPALRVDLGLSLLQSGFVATTLYAIGALVGVFGGTMADRYGQKRFALIGLATMSGGGLIGALAQGFVPLLASRFLEGIGFILFTVGAAPLLVAATRPEDRHAAFSLWSAYMPTGGTLALLAAPLALASFGWRSLWLGVAACTALCAVLLARKVPAPSFGGGVGSIRLLTESVTRPGSLALCVAFICYVGQWSSLMVWLPTFVVDERGMDPTSASLLTALFVAVNIPGNLLGGVLMNRGMPRWAMMAGASVAMGAMTLGIFASSIPDAWRLASVLLFSLLGGLIPSAVFSGTAVHARSPQHIGTTNGMVMQASHLGQFVIPILIAWAASRTGGWEASLGTMLALAAIGLLSGLALRSFERRLQD
jgi:DHA1 family inner membrane transport protein